MKPIKLTRAQNLIFNARRSFRGQLLLISLPSLLLACLVSFGLWLFIQHSVSTEMRLDQSNASLLVLQRVRANVLAAQTAVRGYVISGDETYYDAFTETVENFEQIAAEVATDWPEDAPISRRIQAVTELFSGYRSQVAEPVISLRRSLSASQEGTGLDPQLSSLLARGRDEGYVEGIREQIREGIERNRALLDQALADTRQQREDLVLVGVAGPPVAVFVGLMLYLLLLGRTRRGFQALVDAAGRVEAGQLDWRLDYRDNREMAQVSAGFNSMLANLENRVYQAQALDRLTRVLQSCRTTEEALAVAGRFLPRMLPDHAGTICVYRASRDQVTPTVCWGQTSETVDESRAFEPDDCWALRSGYTHSFVPHRGDPPCEHVLADESAHTLCVPLTSSDETMGVLIIEGGEAKPIDDGIRALCGTLGETLALSIGNIRLREALRHQSIRDPLTGLYNRRFLSEVLERELSRCRRSEQPLACVALDVDHFKRFNDQWGHDAGDAVLTALAQTLTREARDMDLACRLGGEEFLVLLPRCDRDGALLVAERIRSAVETLTVRHRDRVLEPVTVSLGVASYPEQTQNAEALLEMADRALYDAKRAGRNQVRAAAA